MKQEETENFAMIFLVGNSRTNKKDYRELSLSFRNLWLLKVNLSVLPMMWRNSKENANCSMIKSDKMHQLMTSLQFTRVKPQLSPKRRNRNLKK